uniref:Uncharacterized protein n=1 Tax=Rhizophora mucronata TaxID=61149 RepID=A0A2P2P837_RHIMU
MLQLNILGLYVHTYAHTKTIIPQFPLNFLKTIKCSYRKAKAEAFET